MSTDPREFEHPIDGTTPNELPTVLGVGSLTPEAIADTLAYYHCRRVNPKADHPIMGYHTFSEDQREFLRDRQSEAAAEIHRMIVTSAAHAKAEALREAAGEADMWSMAGAYFPEWEKRAEWLRARAATIDRESFIATAMGDPEGRHLAAAAVALANAERKDS